MVHVRPLRIALFAGVAVTLLALSLPAWGASRWAPSGMALPRGPEVRLVQVATAEQPIGVVARRGDPTVYVQEKAGRLRALRDGAWRDDVLDVRSIVSTDNERGLLGVAFSPVDDSHVYAAYTARDGAVTLGEFPFDGTRANEAQERVVLRVPHPHDDHNGGSLAFAPDGQLYIGLGDGGGVGTKGGVGDRANNAQNLGVLLGKVLRIDPRTLGFTPYSATADRWPGDGAGALTSARRRAEIFAYGLRNPWRLSIDDEGTLWVPDVGQSSWEEINRIPLTAVGANFGWRLREGTHAYRGGARPRGAMEPAYEFAHTDGRCAVIGGVKASAGAGAGLAGSYVFGELCTGRLMQLRAEGGTWKAYDLGTRLAYLTSIGSDAAGRLYATSLNGGVYRIDPV